MVDGYGPEVNVSEEQAQSAARGMYFILSPQVGGNILSSVVHVVTNVVKKAISKRILEWTERVQRGAYVVHAT